MSPLTWSLLMFGACALIVWLVPKLCRWVAGHLYDHGIEDPGRHRRSTRH